MEKNNARSEDRDAKTFGKKRNELASWKERSSHVLTTIFSGVTSEKLFHL